MVRIRTANPEDDPRFLMMEMMSRGVRGGAVDIHNSYDTISIVIIIGR